MMFKPVHHVGKLDKTRRRPGLPPLRGSSGPFYIKINWFNKVARSKLRKVARLAALTRELPHFLSLANKLLGLVGLEIQA